MIKGKVTNTKRLGFGHALAQFCALFCLAILVAAGANIGLGPLLIALGIGTIMITVFGGVSMPFMATPSFVFLPALIIFMRGYETLPLGTPAWNFRLGGLLVSLWVSGLLYVFAATLVRYLGIKKMRRIFSPTFSGSLIVLLALASLPRVFMFTFYDPLILDQAALTKYVIIGLMSLFGYVVTTFLSKKPAGQAIFAAFVGLFTGLLVTTIIDAVELLWLSESITNTILFKALTPVNVPLTIFHDLESNFGFWQYLHFDLESLLLVVPLVGVALSEHIHAMTIYVIKQPQASEGLHADKTVLTEGIATMIGSMIGGYPLAISEDTVKIGANRHKARPFILILFAILILTLGMFPTVTYYLGVIPLPVIGGTLIGWISFEAVKGFNRVARLVHDDLHPQATALALIVLGLGITLSTMEFMSDFLGNTMFRMMIGTTPIPSFAIITLLAFLMNLATPRLVE